MVSKNIISTTNIETVHQEITDSVIWFQLLLNITPLYYIFPTGTESNKYFGRRTALNFDLAVKSIPVSEITTSNSVYSECSG
jgi:hypothetical protein